MTQRGKKAKHKGVPCRRGQPIFYNELKKPRNFSLTETAVKNLKVISTQIGSPSLSQALEQILRGELNPQNYLSLENDRDKVDQ